MPQDLHYLKETPSQTAGPYVHIGLAPGAAGFDIYRQELGWDIAGPNAKGERIYHTPWSKYYSRTRIDEAAGERWFCDEAEAEDAGWRRAAGR